MFNSGSSGWRVGVLMTEKRKVKQNKALFAPIVDQRSYKGAIDK
jgi:hypothetical protein